MAVIRFAWNLIMDLVFIGIFLVLTGIFAMMVLPI